MHLIYYESGEEETFVFNNLDVEIFFSTFDADDSLIILFFYGDSREGEFSIEDFRQPICLEDLLTFKKARSDRWYKAFEATYGELQISFIDEYEYHITGKVQDNANYLKQILSVLDLNQNAWDTVLENQRKYLVFEGSNLIDKFDTFRDFIDSKYKDVL